MSKDFRVSLLVLTAVGWMSVAAVETQAQAKPTPKERITLLRKASSELIALSQQKLPRALTKKEILRAQEHTEWLSVASERLTILANRWEEARKAKRIVGATDESFSMQYLNLQRNMEQEAAQFELMARLMKAKHDAAKTAINNIR